MSSSNITPLLNLGDNVNEEEQLKNIGLIQHSR